MTLQPVVPLAILAALAVALVGVRVLGLRHAMRATPRTARRHVLLRWGALTLAAVFLLASAARPGITVSGAQAGSAVSVTGSAQVNVFFLVDRSVDSRVEDFGDRTPRIAGVRTDIAALIDHYRGAQFAVISFSSAAALDWPLSDDVWSLKPLIAGLSTDPTGSPDAMYEVNAAAASDILASQLDRATRRTPGCTNLVFYFGEGASGSRTPQGSFDHGSATPSGGTVFGYGTPAGGPIPARSVNGDVVYAADAPGGAVLNSAINEPGLRSIAGQLGVPYVHRESGQDIVQRVPAVNAENASVGTDVGVGRVVELYWVLALAAATLVLVEIVLTIWGFRRRRSVRVDPVS
jgi:Ca-activated chloride channel family protein